MENIQKPLWKTQTIYGSMAGLRRSPGRPPKVAPMRVTGATGASKSEVGARVQPLRGLHPVRALLREWLLELKVMGRSQRTIDWYAQKMDWYRRSGGAENLEELNAFELKRFLAEQQERGLSDNTIHGFFQVIRSFANWCEREEYPARPKRAADAPAQGGAEGDVDLHAGAGSLDLRLGQGRLAAAGSQDPARHRHPRWGAGEPAPRRRRRRRGRHVPEDQARKGRQVPPRSDLPASAARDHPLHQPEPARQ